MTLTMSHYAIMDWVRGRKRKWRPRDIYMDYPLATRYRRFQLSPYIIAFPLTWELRLLWRTEKRIYGFVQRVLGKILEYTPSSSSLSLRAALHMLCNSPWTMNPVPSGKICHLFELILWLDVLVVSIAKLRKCLYKDFQFLVPYTVMMYLLHKKRVTLSQRNNQSSFLFSNISFTLYFLLLLLIKNTTLMSSLWNWRMDAL